MKDGFTLVIGLAIVGGLWYAATKLTGGGTVVLSGAGTSDDAGGTTATVGGLGSALTAALTGKSGAAPSPVGIARPVARPVIVTGAQVRTAAGARVRILK
jgi:hypothetical protein